MSAGMVAAGVGHGSFGPILGREVVDGSIEPHVGSCGLVADAVFLGCFVPCDFVVVYTTARSTYIPAIIASATCATVSSVKYGCIGRG